MKGILIVLGAPNSPEGVLSGIAINRLTCAYRIYKHNPGLQILCTGGFGEHFNTSLLPHARYAKLFLTQMGVREDSLLEEVLSTNTMEDAALSKRLVEKHKPDYVIVVTSDFHMERAKYWFNRYHTGIHMLFIESVSNLSDEEMQQRIHHEADALQKLNKQK